MPQKLDGKIALVTGGSSGIGLATAKRFVQEGAQVVITGRRKDTVDAAVREIGSAATGYQSDASSLADLDRLFAQIKAQHGRIDIVFANAGSASSQPSISSPKPTSTRPSTLMSKVSFSSCRKRFL